MENGSIAEEMGISPGDILREMNGSVIQDVFDYRFHMKDVYIEVLIEKPDGEEWLLEIDKDEDEDLGVVFETGLMDHARSCTNQCMFCFIDQLPDGLRNTLYFKDDDSRLSFLQGNYVTLTNIGEADLERILYYRLSPINISVHATDPALRVQMLKNPKASAVLEQISRIAGAGIEMNFQVVLVKGVNDGENLDKTISGLSRFIPMGKSLSVVPVGITRHRDGLFPLEPFYKEDCIQVIEQVNKWHYKLSQLHGTGFVYPADEFYIKAGLPYPACDYYEGFPQIENGVGMAASFRQEFLDALKEQPRPLLKQKVGIVTGMAAIGLMKELVAGLGEQGRGIRLYPVANEFFGEQITVSGLITGRDIIHKLKGNLACSELLIPRNCLRWGEDILLDDITREQLEKELNVKITAVETHGRKLLNALLKSTGR